MMANRGESQRWRANLRANVRANVISSFIQSFNDTFSGTLMKVSMELGAVRGPPGPAPQKVANAYAYVMQCIPVHEPILRVYDRS